MTHRLNLVVTLTFHDQLPICLIRSTWILKHGAGTPVDVFYLAPMSINCLSYLFSLQFRRVMSVLSGCSDYSVTFRRFTSSPRDSTVHKLSFALRESLWRHWPSRYWSLKLSCSACWILDFIITAALLANAPKGPVKCYLERQQCSCVSDLAVTNSYLLI